MEKGRVLVIEDDEWMSGVLSKLLRERGYVVEVCREARAGFNKACEWAPDCIICNINLPDIDGFWVARRIRTEATAVATTPFLFLTEEQDPESRLQGLHVGADVYLCKPFTHEEVVAQVEALIDMARRLRIRRDSFIDSAGPSSLPGPVAIRGDIKQMALATVLTILEMERRCGVLRVTTEGGRRATLALAGNGGFGASTLDRKGRPALEVLQEVLRWKNGQFKFQPTEPAGNPASMRRSIGATLLDAMRLEDEKDVPPDPGWDL